jgi:hypothetical protein
MSAHVLPPLKVNSKSEREVNSLLPLEFEPVIFGIIAHLSNHSAKSTPITRLSTKRNQGANTQEQEKKVS